ncbi:hypothetical protein [Candidatus Nitrospira neomarina]|uniref:Uncharacterized protein n=1 Tax=Candidatus Nitrospira neomarina TaxID=3020899 RepID=A0AA96JX20_9BACT|nr:hypothetical protein [Candidatus Nitrospira neomarina]WNM63432.1 hypothetical protein PQG83_06680 [Candidatus Nitrospira neomarina]
MLKKRVDKPGSFSKSEWLSLGQKASSRAENPFTPPANHAHGRASRAGQGEISAGWGHGSQGPYSLAPDERAHFCVDAER